MIYYIIRHIMVFMVVFLVAVVAYANMFFIMQDVATNIGQTPDNSVILSWDFAIACLLSFYTAFGQFDPKPNFTNYGEYQWILWLIYAGLIFLLSLVMLNMIIAIMGDTYDQVMQI